MHDLNTKLPAAMSELEAAADHAWQRLAVDLSDDAGSRRLLVAVGRVRHLALPPARFRYLCESCWQEFKTDEPLEPGERAVCRACYRDEQEDAAGAERDREAVARMVL